MSRIWKHFSTAFLHYHHAVVHVSSLATRSLLARSLASSFGFFLLPLFALSPNKRASYLTSCGKRKRRFTLVKSVGIARNSSEEKNTRRGRERKEKWEILISGQSFFFSYPSLSILPRLFLRARNFFAPPFRHRPPRFNTSCCFFSSSRPTQILWLESRKATA